MNDGIFFVSKRIRAHAFDIFYRSNGFLFIGSHEEVLRNMHHLLTKDSWIWRVKRLYIDTFRPVNDARTWSSILQLLYQWKRVSKGEIIFSFSAFNRCRDQANAMLNLGGFCRVIQQAGFASASVWIPKSPSHVSIVRGIDDMVSICSETSPLHL